MVFPDHKVFAQAIPGKCEIGGLVKDSINGESLPYATVQVLAFFDSVFVAGTMCDARGKFQITDIKPGTYILATTYMGYHDSKKQMDVRGKKAKCNFSLVRKSISLAEISISAEKNLVEKTIDKTTINVSKNLTLSGGTATDVMQTLPSIDIDIDGNINYRGSENVIILINGEKSGLVKSLDQIPADQIKKVEIINNPSAKYEAEGMSGIINLVLKSGKAGKNKTTVMLSAGYPETLGGNIGYSGSTGKTRFFVNAGMKHNTNFQTKEHLRKNYENPNAYDYYQYDRQDQNLNSAFFNSNFTYAINKEQRIGISFVASKKFNNADRQINYESLDKSNQKINETLKEIAIDLNNYTLDGSLNYKYNFANGGLLSSKIHYSFFDQLQEMNNEYYPDLSSPNPDLQNTFSKQINKQADFSFDYQKPINDSSKFETGYYFAAKDLMNDFNSESYGPSGEWLNDTSLNNKFNYIQAVHAVYFSLNTKLKYFELQAGLRAELTTDWQNNKRSGDYFDLFPSAKLSRKLNQHFTIFAAYNRRINRPSIKMLNPFSDEYADVLNMHKGNPNLKPEYVNSIEMGNRFVFKKFSGMGAIYFRHIDQAISRVKSASNDSALYVSFINLNVAKLWGAEISLNYKAFPWWGINTGSNIFYTNLSGEYENNLVDNSKTGWTLNISNNFKLPNNFGIQFSGYYRSKLPSVMGTYKERYYFDFAINKKVLKNKGQLVFKISDLFNTYKFGLDLDAFDANNFGYSQMNRKKNESQYFVLNFIYNIDRKDQQKKKKKRNFFLDDFDR
jgi:outer membrane receptor protein involved in Fe transport